MFPKLVEFGALVIHTYGFLLATAYLAGIAMLARLLEREKINRSRAWDLGFVVIVSAVVGAKLLMVVSDLSSYVREPSLLFTLAFWRAGGAFYGGLLAAIAGSALYVSRIPGMSFWKVADAAAPAIALGQSIGRLGCFASGCDYGSTTSVPWAVTFTSEYAAEKFGVPLHIPLHPTQLYESFATLCICAFLLWRHQRRRFVGEVFSLYLMCYGVIRFALEFYRGDDDRGFVFGGWLSTSQFISLLIVPAGIAVYGLTRARRIADRRG